MGFSRVRSLSRFLRVFVMFHVLRLMHCEMLSFFISCCPKLIRIRTNFKPLVGTTLAQQLGHVRTTKLSCDAAGASTASHDHDQ